VRLDLYSPSEAHTLGIGEALGRVLRAGDVVCLHGELGSGKTCLVRGLARGAGVEWARVCSPTFVVVHEYPAREGSPPGTPPMFHVDAYRLGAATDADTLGWDRVAGGDGIIVVEWPERLEAAGLTTPAARGVSGPRADVTLAHAGEGSRRISLELPASWASREGIAALRTLERELAPQGAGAGHGASGGGLPGGWARCPVSGRAVPPDSPTFPFADERCRLADLNRWFGGTYRVSRGIEAEDLEDPGLRPE
jgi:tRNA threonylcarbamoyladenosine biosynthesis protein TsaE